MRYALARKTRTTGCCEFPARCTARPASATAGPAASSAEYRLILGIRTDLLKERPLRFDVREVLLALLFPAALFHQTVFAPDGVERVVADAQIEFADQTAGAERRQGFAKLEHLNFDVRRSLVRLMVACSGLFEKAGRPMLFKAARPFADGGHSGSEQPCGRLDADVLGALHQAQAMVVERLSSHAPNRNNERRWP